MKPDHQWLVFALGSAVFAAATALFGKLGVSEINSNLATFIRTAIVLAITAGVVTFTKGWQAPDKLSVSGLVFLTLSAVGTGLSWLCYYRALQLGPASKVAPVDKLSVALVVMGAVVFFGESLTWKSAVGALLITGGAVLMAL